MRSETVSRIIGRSLRSRTTTTNQSCITDAPLTRPTGQRRPQREAHGLAGSFSFTHRAGILRALGYIKKTSAPRDAGASKLATQSARQVTPPMFQTHESETSYLKRAFRVAHTRALSVYAQRGSLAMSPAVGSGSVRPTKFLLRGHTKQARPGHREKPRRRRHTTTFFKPT